MPDYTKADYWNDWNNQQNPYGESDIPLTQGAGVTPSGKGFGSIAASIMPAILGKVATSGGAGAAASAIPGLLGAASGPVGLGLSLLPAAFKLFKGISQTHEANKINPVNPGFQMNNGIIDNARILGDKYNDYQMPGYNQAMDNINAGFTQSFDSGAQGASSGGDVLDLATKLDFNRGQDINKLAVQNASGKDAALGEYLNANAAAGNETVLKNAYDRDQYNKELARKAALNESGAANTFSSGDQLASVAGSALNYRTAPWTPSPAKVKILQSLFN